MNKTILVFLLVCFNSLSQNTLKLDNSLTGILLNDQTSSVNITYTGNNSIDFNKKRGVDLVTNYSLNFSPKISQNELNNRINFYQNIKSFNLFSTYQYNYSLSREILQDNWFGIGCGHKLYFDSLKYSISYAFAYNNTTYFNSDYEYVFRHSLRNKFILDRKKISISIEYFYQPNISNFKDYIIYGNMAINLFTNNPLNFSIQDVINYRSNSDVRLIHNLTLGIGYKFDKKIKN